ncbi:MAG: SAM-dependent methyltransferase [Alphaproteobacteria bacterium]
MTSPDPRARCLALLASGLDMGTLHIVESGDAEETLRGALPGVTAKVFFRTPSVYATLLERGIFGFFESWMRGDITSENIGLLVYLVVSNKRLLDALTKGLSTPLSPARRYPLSLFHPDFLSVWMGKTLSFGAGFFDGLVETLDQAIEGRYQTIKDAMMLRDYDALLYVGPTMGAFASFFSQNHATSRLHVLTHGHLQKQTLQKDMRIRGFDKRVTADIFDDTTLQGRYDFIVVNHLFETIPPHQWEHVIYKLKDMLRPEGRCIVQILFSEAAPPQRGTLIPKNSPPNFWSFMGYENAQFMSQEAFLGITQKNYLRVREQRAYPKDMARTCKLLRASLDHHAQDLRSHPDGNTHRLFWTFLLSVLEANCLQGTLIPTHLVLEHDV